MLFTVAVGDNFVHVYRERYFSITVASVVRELKYDRDAVRCYTLRRVTVPKLGDGRRRVSRRRKRRERAPRKLRWIVPTQVKRPGQVRPLCARIRPALTETVRFFAPNPPKTLLLDNRENVHRIQFARLVDTVHHAPP